MNKNKDFYIQNFGAFFRSKRISLGFTLRSFCERYSYDPGNISRLERNILSPSIVRQKLEGYALSLKIPRDSEEWTTFFDLAHAAKGRVQPKEKFRPICLKAHTFFLFCLHFTEQPEERKWIKKKSKNLYSFSRMLTSNARP